MKEKVRIFMCKIQFQPSPLQLLHIHHKDSPDFSEILNIESLLEFFKFHILYWW